MKISLQIAVSKESAKTLPSLSDFQHWANVVDQELGTENAEVCVRIVDNDESADLNQRYRKKPTPTNVLSFPAESPIPTTPVYLGDIVIARQVVADEAKEQDKPLLSHWAHLFIHGILHLQGYRHKSKDEAQRMESCEIRILATLGISNPYQLATA